MSESGFRLSPRKITAPASNIAEKAKGHMESGVAQHGESPTALLSAGGVNPIYSFDAIYSQIESVS